MPTTQDRVLALRAAGQTAFTGIDFIQLEDVTDQKKLRVYFITEVNNLVPPLSGPGAVPLRPEDIRIFSPRGEAPDVRVVADPASDGTLQVKEDPVACRQYVEVFVDQPGGFTDYQLQINDPAESDSTPSRIDPSFNSVTFSFKVGCLDGLDCAEPPLECPEPPKVDFPVDYLARDFVSLRNALLDFAAQRFPEWTLPTEADVGVVLAEVMAALGDEFSYIQDRYNREAYLETATERRSLRHKARLLDFEVHDGRMATTVLDFKVKESEEAATTVDFAVNPITVWATSQSEAPVAFETGLGLLDPSDEDDEALGEALEPTLKVKRKWNLGELDPYCFDDRENCLDVGTTEVVVKNEPKNFPGVPLVDFTVMEETLWVGRLLLLRVTPPVESGRPLRAVVVRVKEVVEEVDQLLGGAELVRIRWEEDDALEFQICQEDLSLSANVVPAVAGQTVTESFKIGADVDPADPELARTVEREGPLDAEGKRPVVHLFSLPGTDVAGLAFRDRDDSLRSTIPEIVLEQDGSPGTRWVFRRSLVTVKDTIPAFTLEDGTWRRIVAFERDGAAVVHRDYAGSAGYTIRFGDGEFGQLPAGNFTAKYRLGSGARANLPSGTVSVLNLPDQAQPGTAKLEAVTNPLAVTNGVDPESTDDIKKLTPEAYKAEVNFALRPEDYGRQAERLDFVQRARGTLRWTGSWHTVLASVDPRNAFVLNDDQREELNTLYDCVRQAGRDVVVRDPKFLNLDLEITVCLEKFAFPGQVKKQVLEVLFGRNGVRPLKGFFDPDNFTFGTPLRRSSLEAAVQSVAGVQSVVGIRIRPQGLNVPVDFEDLVFEVASDEVIRVENDLLRPERGTVVVVTKGGA